MIWHLFTLAFVVLQLVGYIDWSWFAVLSPSIIYLSLKLLIILGVFFLHFKTYERR